MLKIVFNVLIAASCGHALELNSINAKNQKSLADQIAQQEKALNALKLLPMSFNPK